MSETIQNFIPVKEIRNGYIETFDNRLIKILEIEPINFALCSEDEQIAIVTSFASWLKIAPVNIRFKSVTRRADICEHIKSLRDDIKRERNATVENLGEGYISLIEEVGMKEALTRRFFLIFESSTIIRLTSDISRAYSEMWAVEQAAKNYFLQCGNKIIEPQDEDEFTAEILYMLFNRKMSENKPFLEHVKSRVLDIMGEKNLKYGTDKIPDIPAVEFFAPREMDFSHPDYVKVDGTYYSFLYIRGNGYPTCVRAGWTSVLVNAGDGVDVDVILKLENRNKAVDSVSQKIRLNRTKFKNTQDTSGDYEELSDSINAGYYIKQGLANNEDLYYMSIFITITADSLDALRWRKLAVTDNLYALDIRVSDNRFQQEEAYKSTMPFFYVSNAIERKSKRNVLTSGAASTYMFTSYEMCDDNGILLGINKHNNSLCVVDLFNTNRHKNANLNIIGTSGAGKTFTLQLLALRMRMRGIQCFIIAPIKGQEFYRACEKIGGSFIKISPGSKHCINVMEIRRTASCETNFIDKKYSENESLLDNKIQQLLMFFTLLIPDITGDEEQILDDAIIKTYADYGITNDNRSVFENGNAYGKTKRMPILGDLYKNLCGNPKSSRITAAMNRFVNGSAQSFNNQTNVDLDNKYIVLDLSELKGKMLPVGMMIVLDFVWDKVKADRTKKKAILIDEIWQLVGASSNSLAAEFCLTIFKTIRGYGGAAVSATQDLSDFFGLEDGKYGRAIINNSQNKIILGLESDEADYVKDVLKLTKPELRSIIGFKRGEALVCSGSNKVPVEIKASETEKEIITTDRAELESLLKRRQKDVKKE